MTTWAEEGIGRKSVNMQTGQISREIFVSDEIYRRELEQIFARTWLFVGHESQVPNPDDYFISRMGEESVILTRDRQNQLHVLLNTCTHRGMKVVRYDQGNTRTFSCPYHGWSFSTDGSLVSVPGELLGVPQYRAAYHEQLDKQEWGLIQVAQMINYKGSIWATWDPDAPSWDAYIGGMKVFLDVMLDHRDGREGGSEVVGGVYKWRLPTNWKFCTENFIGDAYHGISHQSVEIVGIGPGGPGSSRQGGSIGSRNRPGHIVRRSFGSASFPNLGHGALGGEPVLEDFSVFPSFVAPTGPADNIPVVAEYFAEVAAKRAERLKGVKVPWGGPASVFPNMSYHARIPRTIAVWHPVGPMLTEGWRWTLVDADAPQEVKDLLRHHFMRYSGPAGLTEEDDMENWNYAGEASQGTIARRKPYNYSMGVGFEQPLEGVPGAVYTEATTEQNQRGFYNRWAQLMDTADWRDLPPNV